MIDFKVYFLGSHLRASLRDRLGELGDTYIRVDWLWHGGCCRSGIDGVLVCFIAKLGSKRLADPFDDLAGRTQEDEPT